MENQNNKPSKRQIKDTENNFNNDLYELLYKQTLSRRTAVTLLGYPDQSFKITQIVIDWIKEGKAMVIGRVKCSRSGRLVGGITTNPSLFPKDNTNQLKLF